MNRGRKWKKIGSKEERSRKRESKGETVIEFTGMSPTLLLYRKREEGEKGGKKGKEEEKENQKEDARKK